MEAIRINKRDIKVFLFGVFSWLIIQVIWDWKEIKQDFIDGFNACFTDTRK